MAIQGRDDHEIYNGTDTERFRLIRDENRAAMYTIENFVPQYRNPLAFIQDNWIGGHGQYEFKKPDAYFEGQSIDTTQEGRVFLGPLPQHQGDDQGSEASIGAAPTHYCWFPAITKLLCATATSTWVLDVGGWNSSTDTIANITQMVVFGTNVYAARSSGNYYYSANGHDWTDGGDTANGFLTAPNSAGTAEVLWRFETPNKVSSSTDGTTWTSDALIGDTANNITNIFLANDKLLAGRTDGLFHYDSDGGIHQLRPDLRRNRSTDNFKYVTEWQAGVYHSEIDGMGEITSYNAYEPMGPLTGIDDIGRRGDIVGLAADKDWIYAAIYDGTNYYIYKGREVRKQGVLRWQWCPFIYLGANATGTLAVVQHDADTRKLWFGYGTNSYYVVLSDNPLVDSTYRYCAAGWLRMSYDYGTDPEWDKLWQSAVIEQTRFEEGVETVAEEGETTAVKYRDDADLAVVATAIVAAYTTVGVVETNFTSALNNKRVSFELHLAQANGNTATPVVTYFQAKGVEKPVRTRIHEAVYVIGDEPSNRAKTLRDFFRTARTSTTLLKFADLRYGESTSGSTPGTDYVYCVLEPESPEQVEIIHRKDGSKELGMRVRLREVSFS